LPKAIAAKTNLKQGSTRPRKTPITSISQTINSRLGGSYKPARRKRATENFSKPYRFYRMAISLEED